MGLDADKKLSPPACSNAKWVQTVRNVQMVDRKVVV